MTALNWESLKRSTYRSDYSGDDLPRAGSWADQRRSGATASVGRRYAAATRYGNVRSRSNDFQGLNTYVTHALSSEFTRKPDFMQREIVEVIARLRTRCISWVGSQSPAESEIMKAANALLAVFSRSSSQ